MKNFIQKIKGFFVKPDVTSSLWEYGTCEVNGNITTPARKHKIKGNVQFILWKAGEQGHKEHFWHDIHISHWENFTPTKTKAPTKSISSSYQRNEDNFQNSLLNPLNVMSPLSPISPFNPMNMDDGNIHHNSPSHDYTPPATDCTAPSHDSSSYNSSDSSSYDSGSSYDNGSPDSGGW